jgi:hypothetical protein
VSRIITALLAYSLLSASCERNGDPSTATESTTPDGDQYSIEIVAEEGQRPPSPWKLPARWNLEIRSQTSSQVTFRAAFAIDGHLELLETTTPYDKEFTASRVLVFFETTAGGSLSVVAYSDASGIYTQQAAHRGSGAGRIVFDETIGVYLAGSL